MRYFIWVSIAYMVLGCNEDRKPDEPFDRERRHERMVEIRLKGTAEKIVFISTMMNIPYDTMYNILLHYTIKTDRYSHSDDSIRINSNMAIEFISSKYRLSRKKISRILFAYKFEMITREEVEEETLENADQDVAPEDGPDY